MKVSLNWLKDYIDITLDPEAISQILTGTGLEVESLEERESVTGGLAGVVVGQVLECSKHPGADSLSLTKVDIGKGEALSIVCGAPNVAAGQKVLVATVGTTIYPVEGDPITLKKAKIRGEVSEGMICAADELGVGTDHSGILVLPAETLPGQSAREFFNNYTDYIHEIGLTPIRTDYIYEIGLTPNRSDATNHIGVARDLSAALQINHGHEGRLKKPSVAAFQVDNHELPVEVVVENTEACPRYTGVSIQGVTIGESPDWLKEKLRAIDLRPINNIVDITNFVLHELGQPLHAFDLDAITGRKVIVKTLPAGTPFVSLDEMERKLHPEDLMICDGASNGMCIGGVFGGLNSGVKDATRNIFLEAAHFNPQYIRRSSMRHNLRTDAARVFEKGSDPNITLYALKRAALLIRELGGGKIASEIVDIYPQPIAEKEIAVSYSYVNRLIGLSIPKEKVKAILSALEMNIVAETEDTFTVAVPTNKVDVLRPADVVEEILRIFGFNNVPIGHQIRSAMVISPKPDPGVVRNAVSDMLTAGGFFEIMALSLSESRYYRELLPSVAGDSLVYVNNTSNIQLDIMRPAMLFSGLEAVERNQNRQRPDLKLFEFGRTYRQQEGGGFEEVNHLTLFLTGQRYPESWLNADKAVVSFYSLKAYVHQVLDRLGLSGYQEEDLQNDIFQFAYRYFRGDQLIVEFGRLQNRLVKGMGLKQPVFYADFQWDVLLKSLRKQRVVMQELNKYPRVRRDLALVVANSVKFKDIVSIARQVGKKVIKEVNLFDVYVNAQQLGADMKSYAVSFIFEDNTKTLQDKEVDKVMERLINTFETQLAAKIRR